MTRSSEKSRIMDGLNQLSKAKNLVLEKIKELEKEREDDKSLLLKALHKSWGK